MSENRRLKHADALRKEILVTRIELRREQLKMSAATLKANLRQSAPRLTDLPSLLQTGMAIVLPCGIYFGSRRRVKVSEAIRIGLAALRLVNRVMPLVHSGRLTRIREQTF
jgi:hypothetical protein